MRPLERAVVGVIHTLHTVLNENGFGFDLNKGFRIESPDHLNVHHDDALVTARAFGWKRSWFITTRFTRGKSGWELCADGEVVTDHIRIRFTPSKEGLGIRLVPRDEDQRRVMVSSYEHLIAALKRDLETIQQQ